MANILVSDLQPNALGLFDNSESLIDSMQTLSDREMKITRGGDDKKEHKGEHEEEYGGEYRREYGGEHRGYPGFYY